MKTKKRKFYIGKVLKRQFKGVTKYDLLMALTLAFVDGLLLVGLMSLLEGCSAGSCATIGGSYKGVSGSITYCFGQEKKTEVEADIQRGLLETDKAILIDKNLLQDALKESESESEAGKPKAEKSNGVKTRNFKITSKAIKEKPANKLQEFIDRLKRLSSLGSLGSTSN